MHERFLRSADRLSSALEDWGRHASLPQTPDIASSVASSLRSPGLNEAKPQHGRSLLRWFTDRRAPVAAMALAAGMAVVLVTAILPAWNHPPSIQVARVLRQAARAGVTPGQVTHLVYRVRIVEPGGTMVTNLNVWSGQVDGDNTAVEVERSPGISAARFIERHGLTTKTWTSAGRLATLLRRTPITCPDGAFVAAKVLAMTRSHSWQVRAEGEHRVSSRLAYVLSVSGAGFPDGPVRLAFAVGTYDLLRITNGSYSARLTARQLIPESVAPEFIVASLKATRPDVTSPVAATY